MDNQKLKFVLHLLMYAVGPAMFVSGLLASLGFRLRGGDNSVWIGVLLIGFAYSLKKQIEDKK